jgi:hypothetical protein
MPYAGEFDMKALALPALAAGALALGACSEANAPTPAEDETVVDETVAPAPEETTIITQEPVGDPDMTGDRMTVDENGLEADLGDENTRVRADVDGDPSLTVETD